MWRQGQTHQPYTLSFLGTWGHGDSTLRYIPTETGTDTPPLYTLISGDGGHGDSSLGYIQHVTTVTGTDTSPIYTLILGTWGQLPRIYKYGDRDIKYHPYTLSFLGTWAQFSRIYTYIIGADHTTPIHSDLKLHSCI